jgi:hypothetical protein
MPRKHMLPDGNDIHGISCRLRNAGVRRAIRLVLDRIRDRRPGDFAALQRLVREIVPVPAAKLADDPGMLGQWCPDPDLPPWDPNLPDPDHLRPTCVVMLLDKEHEHLVATVAHEFGHACSTDEDRRRRGGPDEEWATELTADWYACRWGFGREIARQRPTLRWIHHLGGPGFKFKWLGTWYRVTRSLCIREV